MVRTSYVLLKVYYYKMVHELHIYRLSIVIFETLGFVATFIKHITKKRPQFEGIQYDKSYMQHRDQLILKIVFLIFVKLPRFSLSRMFVHHMISSRILNQKSIPYKIASA